MKKLLAIFVWFAVGILAYSLYGVAWGFDFPYPDDALQKVSSGVSTANIITATSSSSVHTVLSAWGQSTSGAVTTYSCGPVNLFSVPNVTNAVSQHYVQAICTGYSVKYSISSGTGAQNVIYIIGTPAPPATASLGEISVDTSGIETELGQLFVLCSWFGAFVLFVTVFFSIISYFRRR